MDDLISRQAAIDEAKEWIDAVYFEENDKRERKAIECFIGSLKNMPSAQQWIPCSERLPEENTIVLATTADYMYIVEFEVYSNGHMYWNEVNEYRSIADVIAWMPLPEPYKGEES